LDKLNFSFPGSINNGKLEFLLNSVNSEHYKTIIQKVDLNDFNKQARKLEKPFMNYWVIYLIISILIFIVLYTIIKKFNLLKVKKESIQFRFNRIHLNEMELEYMKLLLSHSIVENSKLINLLPDTIELSHKSRIKNGIIEDLNNKMTLIAGNRYLIEKIRSKEDRRYFNYKLNRL